MTQHICPYCGFERFSFDARMYLAFGGEFKCPNCSKIMGGAKNGKKTSK
jgi:transcription initiation factor IIE alpha subunit